MDFGSVFLACVCHVVRMHIRVCSIAVRIKPPVRLTGVRNAINTRTLAKVILNKQLRWLARNATQGGSALV